MGHDLYLTTLATPPAPKTSAVQGNEVDVQIGGGMRVGDALQAIVGFKLIAI
jgi:hypothetical protein